MTESETILNFVCPDCSTVNRVPEARTADAPVCGKCKNALIPATPVVLTDENFEAFISKSSMLVIVDFWASWCGPCRMMAPAYEAAAGQLAPDIILAKLNTDDARQSAAGFSIAGIPCLIAFRDGQEVKRQSGVMSESEIVEWARNVD